MIVGLTARMSATSMPRRARASGRKLVRKMSLRRASSRSTSLPDGRSRAIPMLRFPRLGCSMSGWNEPWATPPVPIWSPRWASPVTACSTLTTSAPQSARTAPAAGVKVNCATSTIRTPFIGWSVTRPPRLVSRWGRRAEPCPTRRRASPRRQLALDLALVGLVGGEPRDPLHGPDLDPGRDLERRHVAAGPAGQLARVDRRPVGRHQHRRHLLAPFGVRQPDHEGVEHLGVLLEGELHLARRHVGPLGLDHLGVAADVVGPPAVHEDPVAGVEPPLGVEDVLALLLVVTGHQPGTPDGQLALLALGHLGPG